MRRRSVELRTCTRRRSRCATRGCRAQRHIVRPRESIDDWTTKRRGSPKYRFCAPLAANVGDRIDLNIVTEGRQHWPRGIRTQGRCRLKDVLAWAVARTQNAWPIEDGIGNYFVEATRNGRGHGCLRRWIRRPIRPRCALCCLVWHFGRANAKTPAFRAGVSGLGSLTITYFHTGIRTIIGVESFHGPVRDGKGWDRLAMVIRQRGLLRCFAAQPILEEAVI